MIQTSELWVGGWKASSPIGPYGAPRFNGLDIRWSHEGFLMIVTTKKKLLAAAWSLARDAWDQGAREHAAGLPNPFFVNPIPK